MYPLNSFRSLTGAACAAMFLLGCSSTPTTSTAPATASAATAPAPAPAAHPATAKPAASSNVTLAAHLDPNSALSRERSVYFDYDDFTVKSQYNGLIERHGKYLQAHPELSIRIEGNADERGSAEYNLSLGQKRSEAVLRALKIYGVKDSQMEAVSYGEERPRAKGHDETAWTENRRADLQYPGR